MGDEENDYLTAVKESQRRSTVNESQLESKY